MTRTRLNPKFVVVLRISVAAISILMLPAEVANRQACRHAIYNRACNFTLPMKDLWLAVYILDVVLVFFVIPFAMFYYEGDQDNVIQFCSTAFAYYAQATAAQEIFGHTFESLRGIKYLYKFQLST